MKYLVTGEEMKQYDRHTIDGFGMESLVLMERAALATAEEVSRRIRPQIACPGRKHICRPAIGSLSASSQIARSGRKHILVIAGCGNNGGDGLAAGRLLALEGQAVTFVLIGDRNKCSRETASQISILEKYGFPIQSKIEKREYDIVIDALFGIGLNKEITGEYREAVESINQLKSDNTLISSMDIPSGIHAGTGAVLGDAVRADFTVTCGFAKRGHFLYPGSIHTGELIVRDIGITEHSFRGMGPEWFTYDSLADIRLPSRDQSGNKGTFGKVLLIAGQENMAGACRLAGRGIMRSGAGMVKIITHESNRVIIQETLPEAMVSTYGMEKEENDFTALREKVLEDMKWAGCVVIGPGLGMTAHSEWLLRTVLSESDLPLVMDADAVNLLGKQAELRRLAAGQRPGRIIMTPHMGEFAKLVGCGLKDTGRLDFDVMRKTADEFQCVLVCKDARTFVCEAGRREGYLNTSGNSGMATAGSGDVLAGIIGGLTAQGMKPYAAACTGVYIHGAAGDAAAREKSEYGLMATDIAEAVSAVLRQILKEINEVSIDKYQ